MDWPKEHGKRPEEYVVLLAAQTREFEGRVDLQRSERTQWAAGIYSNHRREMRRLPKLLESPTVSRAQVKRPEATSPVSSGTRSSA
jgi:hypothetical protein